MTVNLSFADIAIDYTTMVGVFITLCISTVLFYNQFKYPEYIQHTNHKHIATAAIVFYTISMISMCSYHVITKDRTVLAYTVGWEVFALFWGIANCLSYLLFILRLKSTFQYSYLNTPSIVYYSLYTCVILFFIANICVMVIYALKYQGKISTEMMTDLHTAELVAKFLVDIYLSSALTYLFVSKLIQLAVSLFDNQCADMSQSGIKTPPLQPILSANASQSISTEAMTLPLTPSLTAERSTSKSVSWKKFRKSVHNSVTGMEDDPMIQAVMKLTEHDEQLLLIANKMTVLSTTMALSTEFVICVAVLSSEMGDGFLNGFLWYFGVMFCLIIDSMINTFCIFISLPYPISRKMYKCCCRCCDRCCMYCAIRKLQKKKFQNASTKFAMNEYVLMDDIKI